MNNIIEFSEDIVEKIRTDLSSKTMPNNDFCVVVTGSYGRNEASSVSDMDWFIISKEGFNIDDSETIKHIVTEAVNNLVEKNVGETGTFGGIIKESELLVNFGGDKETNQDFTRRMLYMLESKWLFNEKQYVSLKKTILEKYIKNDLPDSSLNRFMLNDVIRYYRTICTDYEYKVHENGKSWGVRKIKLRFSRKLLYFSGLITIASTSNFSREKKIAKTLLLLDLTPIERIILIIGKQQTKKMLCYYKEFLDEISKDSVRESLNNINTRVQRKENLEYQHLKNLSQHFNWELEKCFSHEFPPSHPIHAALIF